VPIGLVMVMDKPPDGSLEIRASDGLLELLEKLGWKRQTPYIARFVFVQSLFVQSRSLGTLHLSRYNAIEL
jgi:hypothetical protein